MCVYILYMVYSIMLSFKLLAILFLPLSVLIHTVPIQILLCFRKWLPMNKEFISACEIGHNWQHYLKIPKATCPSELSLELTNWQQELWWLYFDDPKCFSNTFLFTFWSTKGNTKTYRMKINDSPIVIFHILKATVFVVTSRIIDHTNRHNR